MRADRIYVRFVSGDRIYTRESLNGDVSTTNMQYISSEEAYEFLRKEEKTNHVLPGRYRILQNFGSEGDGGERRNKTFNCQKENT